MKPKERIEFERVPSLALLFSLVLAANVSLAAEFRFEPAGEKSLKLWEGTNEVFVYNYGVLLKQGVPADRARSTYVHPLFGLDGEVLTDDFPKDHYHHRGLFWAWPHVQAGSKEYDLWMLKGVEQRFEKWLEKSVRETALLRVENGWYVGQQKIMKEQVAFRVYPVEKDSRAIDVELVLAALGQPVALSGAEGKSYGGLTLRFAPGTNIVITTPLGNGKEDLPMTRLPWADLSGKFKGSAQTSGAAILVAPNHPDFPPMWLTRHYGVLCLGWPGIDPQILQPGKPVRLQYRVWVHRGAPGAEQLQAAHAAYAQTLKSADTR